MTFLLSFCILFGLLFFVDGEKRLLLNDPALLQSQLHDLEVKLTDLMSKYNAQEADLNDLKSKYQSLMITNNDLGIELQSIKAGAMYVRWGKKTCPSNTTEQIYSGFVGGSNYHSGGGAAEYVCLPPDPAFESVSSLQFHYMHGGEYDNPQAGLDHGEDAPCAVCRSITEVSTMMIPGRSTCYPGWTRQYHGYLAAGHENQPSATQFICIDEHPDVLFGGQGGSLDGRIISPVKAKCGGSLECPPYHD